VHDVECILSDKPAVAEQECMWGAARSTQGPENSPVTAVQEEERSGARKEEILSMRLFLGGWHPCR
jgi:hypothetical protein